MELTYNDLKKRDVINIADGKCLGRISDMRFSFPKGVIVGIYVPGRKTNCITRIFDRTLIYIDESRIIKIGGDVILVNLGENQKPIKDIKKCPPPCPSPCPPPCPSPCPPRMDSDCDGIDFSQLSGGKIDLDDY